MRHKTLLSLTLAATILALLGLYWQTPSGIASAPTESVTLLAQADTWVDEATPNSTHGGEMELRVGRVGTALATNREIYLRFDLTSLPTGAIISDARLDLFQNSSLGTGGYNVWPDAANAAWDEGTLAWVNRPGGTTQGDAPLVVASGSGSRSWNVTTLVQRQVSGELGAFGIVLRGDGSTLGERVFVARNNSLGPKLIITFTNPANSPTPTHTPTRTPTRTPPIIVNPPTNTPTRTPPIIVNPPTNTPTRTPPIIVNPPTNTHTPTPTPLADIQILGMEITQGMQNMANQMPLLAGRETRIRVYVKRSSVGDDLPDIKARVRAYRNGVELAHSPWLANTPVDVNGDMTLEEYRSAQDKSFTFYVFPEWHNQPGAITFTVEVNYDKAVAESNHNNNSISRSVTFNSVPARPKIVMIPLELYPEGNKNYPAYVYTHEDPDWARITLHLKRYHPVDEFYLWYATFALKAGDGQAWTLTGEKGRNTVLNALSYWRLHEGKNAVDNTQTLVGMVHPDISMGLVAGVHKSGEVLVGMSTETNGWAPWYVQGGVTLAHEIGHAKGLQHPGCMDEELYTDPNYPWSDRCMLAPNDPQGYYGLGLYYSYTNTPKKGQIFPNYDVVGVGGPLLSYNKPQWISPYEYCRLLKVYGVTCSLTFGLMSQQANEHSHATTAERAPLAQSTELLLVSGVISPSAASGFFTWVEQLADPTQNARTLAAEQEARDPQTSADPRVTLLQLSASGAVLSTREALLTEPSGVESAVATRSFFEVVPLEPGVARVQMRLNGNVIAERVVSANPPTVRLLSPNSGPVGSGTTLTWSASDADGDALRFALFYSADAGQSWTLMVPDLQGTSYRIPDYDKVPGTTQGRFRVQANDGFHTVTDESDGLLSAENHAPTVKILTPTGLVLQAGEAASFEGIVTDIDEGQLASDRLSWGSNLDGPLGSGGLIGTTLSTGVHQLTARASDSTGRSGSDTITVYVGVPISPLYLPILKR